MHFSKTTVCSKSILFPLCVLFFWVRGLGDVKTWPLQLCTSSKCSASSLSVTATSNQHHLLAFHLSTFITLSKEEGVGDAKCMYAPWHQTCQRGLAPAELCTKSMQHLCKHMAFFRRHRQSSRGLQIDVAGNLDRPEGTQKQLWRGAQICMQQHGKRQAVQPWDGAQPTEMH